MSSSSAPSHWQQASPSRASPTRRGALSRATSRPPRTGRSPIYRQVLLCWTPGAAHLEDPQVLRTWRHPGAAHLVPGAAHPSTSTCRGRSPRNTVASEMGPRVCRRGLGASSPPTPQYSLDVRWGGVLTWPGREVAGRDDSCQLGARGRVRGGADGAASGDEPLVGGARAGVCAPAKGEGALEALLSPLSPNPNPNNNATSLRGVTSRFFFQGLGNSVRGRGRAQTQLETFPQRDSCFY